MEGPLIGLVGILVGVLLGEYFRRRNRIETYAQKVFDRRLEVYEELIKRVQSAYTIANEIMTNTEFDDEQRQALMSASILAIAGYVDENPLYINTYVGADVTAIFMGAEDIQSIPIKADREAAIADIRDRYKSTRQLLFKESGIHEINKHFKLISRSEPDSPIISRVKELENSSTRAKHAKFTPRGPGKE